MRTDEDLWNKVISYNIFEKVEEIYYGKHGNKKFYQLVARVDKRAPLNEVYDLLQSVARDYLKHRYHVSCDNVYWKRFLEQTDNCVVWLDYSQNIKLTPKTEAQSAHFSGKQQTLHDSLIRDPVTK